MKKNLPLLTALASTRTALRTLLTQANNPDTQIGQVVSNECASNQYHGVQTAFAAGDVLRAANSSHASETFVSQLSELLWPMLTPVLTVLSEELEHCFRQGRLIAARVQSPKRARHLPKNRLRQDGKVRALNAQDSMELAVCALGDPIISALWIASQSEESDSTLAGYVYYVVNNSNFVTRTGWFGPSVALPAIWVEVDGEGEEGEEDEVTALQDDGGEQPTPDTGKALRKKYRYGFPEDLKLELPTEEREEDSALNPLDVSTSQSFMLGRDEADLEYSLFHLTCTFLDAWGHPRPKVAYGDAYGMLLSKSQRVVSAMRKGDSDDARLLMSSKQARGIAEQHALDPAEVDTLARAVIHAVREIRPPPGSGERVGIVVKGERMARPSSLGTELRRTWRNHNINPWDLTCTPREVRRVNRM